MRRKGEIIGKWKMLRSMDLEILWLDSGRTLEQTGSSLVVLTFAGKQGEGEIFGGGGTATWGFLERGIAAVRRVIGESAGW